MKREKPYNLKLIYSELITKERSGIWDEKTYTLVPLHDNYYGK